MVSLLLVLGVAVAVFVGFNIGGSSTGVAFGPAVGSGLLAKLPAAALMTVFVLLGAATAGRGVIQTLGGEIVPSSEFTLLVSVIILLFVGLALLVSNTFGVPASTSMTAVGAIAGLGVATGTLQEPEMARIVGWWLVSPVLAFWICAVVGRYLYPYLDASFRIDRSPGAVLERDGLSVSLAEGTTRREFVGTVAVVVVACYMAFSAGASNAANAVGPLVGSPAANVSVDAGILLASGAIGLGAFTIARRTLDTVGNDLTDLPILAALIVEVVSASLITFLSWIDVPASLAVSATMSIVGLGWGRATRTATLGDAVRGDAPDVSVDALAAEAESTPTADGQAQGDGGAATTDGVPELGETDEDLLADDLFDPGTTGRVIFFWILTPSLSFAASYALFRFVPL
ncbi:anion permease [Halobaculum sp. MBLA0147]|uniref:inorganic phosphate transporter n=1 Tax=Halobaculum sp. MBLA0147 TaxID=3079934 RepID=UPI003523658B